MTIDCGGDAAGIPSMLRVLAETDAPATFFVTGRWAESFPDEASQIAAHHDVGNHTYDHPHLLALSDGDVRSQIDRAAATIASVTGAVPVPAFRFPYGERDPRTLAIAAGRGYTSIYWTVDTLGWKGRTDGRSPQTVVARVLSALRPGAIVLMHSGAAPDGSTLDADALTAVIHEIRARGYRLVAITPYL